MKHLLKFNENIVIRDKSSDIDNDPILLELKDILLELETDNEKFSILVTRKLRNEKNQYYIAITLDYNLNHDSLKSFDYSEVSDVVDRIKDYINELGDYTFKIGDVYELEQKKESDRFYLQIHIRENGFK